MNNLRLVDCHRHLGGSFSYQFVWQTIQQLGLYYLAESLDDVVQAMTFAPQEPRGFHRFLDKFAILDKIEWTEELIDESIRAACGDLIDDGIDYTWMRFSINKYMTYLDWHRKDAILFVRDAFDRYAPGRVGLVLSVKYESQRANQRQVAALIQDPDVADALVGIDLVGAEEYFDPTFYRPLFCDWALANKRLFAHVGESQPASNIMAAMVELGVRDICHGIRAVSYPDGSVKLDGDVIAYALRHDVCFHLALSSNLLTGVLEREDLHPISALLVAGVKVTIGTDDPIQCSTSLRKEYDLLRGYLEMDGMSPKTIESYVRLVQTTAVERVKGNIYVGHPNRLESADVKAAGPIQKTISTLRG